MPKRTQGRKSGTILPRGEGKWLIRWFAGKDPKTGKRRYPSEIIEGTFKQAQLALNRKVAAEDDGSAMVSTKQTLGEFIITWLRDTKSLEVTESTLKSYTNRVVPDVVDRIGNLKLTAVTTQHIQEVYTALHKEGLSPRTIRYTHTVLSNALEKAVELRLIPSNPAGYTTLPRQKHKEMRVWTASQVNLFLEKTAGTRDHAFWAVSFGTGLRPGEQCALKWSDLDGNRLEIRRAISQGSEPGSWVVKSPKTKRSRRSVPLSDDLVALLKEHRKAQLAEMLEAGPAYDRQDWIFADKFGQHEVVTRIRTRFGTAGLRAGIPGIRLYDIRHTHATLLLQAGVNPKVVSERLGHASVVITLDTYSHVIPTMQEDAVSRLDLLLKSAQQ